MPATDRLKVLFRTFSGTENLSLKSFLRNAYKFGVVLSKANSEITKRLCSRIISAFDKNQANYYKFS
jgi:hypothetical protein